MRDDAVSRDAVDDILCLYSDKSGMIDARGAVRMVRELPSVTQKSGKWINKEFRKEEYVLTGKCSVCGRVRVIDEFCSHCGAKMVEPQESESEE